MTPLHAHSGVFETTPQVTSKALVRKFILGGKEFQDIFHKIDNPYRTATRQAADPISIAVRCSRTGIRKYSFRVVVTDT
jgi:hypothetical protein